MQDEVGRRETVEEGRRRGNYDAEDLEEDVRIFFQFLSVLPTFPQNSKLI